LCTPTSFPLCVLPSYGTNELKIWRLVKGDRGGVAKRYSAALTNLLLLPNLDERGLQIFPLVDVLVIDVYLNLLVLEVVIAVLLNTDAGTVCVHPVLQRPPLETPALL